MFFAREPFVFPAELSQSLATALQENDSKLMSRRQESLRRLWEKLAKERGQSREDETHYSFRRDEADAYAAYYLPANCLKTALVMEESLLAGVDPMPGNEASWLDLGTGPGTAFWGLAWWSQRRGKKLRFTGWDQSPVFASTARDLVAASPFPARAEFLSGKEKPLDLVRKLKPTHVSFVNSVAEIYREPEKRLAEIAAILRCLRDLEKGDGKERFLLLIEPGSRESSRELATLKDALQTQSHGQVIFPCLDSRPCGALVDSRDWCHEEAACEFPAWLNELGAGAGMRKEALLFSYAWLRAGAPRAAPAGASLRIVSQRMERKGQVECRLCTPQGKRPVRVQRSKADEKSEFFLEAVRGDLWRSAEIGEKTDLAGADQVAAEKSIFFED